MIKTSKNGNGAKAPKPKTKNISTKRKPMQVQNVTTSAVVSQQNVRPVQNQNEYYKGSDFISRLTVKAQPATAADRILASFPISPSAFPGTRLTQMSNLYQFFRFRRLRLRWVPAVPISLACQLVLYVDLDPNEDPSTITAADQLIRKATAQTGSQQWNFLNTKNIPMPMRSDMQSYFTGDPSQNLRLNTQGVAYVIQISDCLNFEGNPISASIEAGSIYFDWDCMFNIPYLGTEVVGTTPSDVATISATMGSGTATYSGFQPESVYSYTFQAEGDIASDLSFLVSTNSDSLAPGFVDNTVTFTRSGTNSDYNGTQGNTLMYALTDSFGTMNITTSLTGNPAGVIYTFSLISRGKGQSNWIPSLRDKPELPPDAKKVSVSTYVRQ